MARDHGDGGIDERGPDRWRLRWRVDGKRFTKSFHGSISEARKELRRLIKSADDGQHVAPDKLVIAEYLRGWLDADPGISPKTRERYRQLAERQIIPHLGTVTLQKLRPVQVSDWHTLLLKTGLAPRTVGHAHRVLHRGLERAVALEIVSRNVAHPVSPPKVQRIEVAILTAGQIANALHRIEDHPLHSIAALAVGTGMRRGEICGLTWGAVDLDLRRCASSAVWRKPRPDCASSRRRPATEIALSAYRNLRWRPYASIIARSSNTVCCSA